MLITDPDARLLVIERATAPVGIAPPAGYVFDAHPNYLAAARAEVAEELGLTVTTLTKLPVGGWRPNRCRRLPGPAGVGHFWQLYRAIADGTLRPSPREAATDGTTTTLRVVNTGPVSPSDTVEAPVRAPSTAGHRSAPPTATDTASGCPS